MVEELDKTTTLQQSLQDVVDDKNKCCHCLNCDIVGHCTLKVYAYEKPLWFSGCSGMVKGTHEQLNGKNKYYYGDLG